MTGWKRPQPAAGKFNYAYFNLNIDSSSAKEITKDLESYIQRLGDNRQVAQ